MKTSERLLAAAEEIWEAYHVHPFVRGIADGTLDQARFRFYMIQDYLYLKDYARVFALGVAKAGDEETMKLFAGYIHQIFYGEMDIHRGYMKRLGIDLKEAEEASMSLDNRSYTAYMLQAAYEGGAAEIAAAILSCALSYEFIARRIAEENPASLQHPFYGEWIEGYACDAYHEANAGLIGLMDRLGSECTEKQLKKLEEIFIVCSRYEMSFWDMAWEMRD